VARYKVSVQWVPCDDCGRMVAVMAREPKDLGDGMTLAHVAVAWADSHFRCAACKATSSRSEALRNYLGKFR
jgi:hypothetical protein